MRIGRMSIYDMGRRISLGGREGDLASQVNGLRMLLDRKNTELEALRVKAEAGQAAVQASESLQLRAEEAQALAGTLGEEATRLGLDVDRLRGALAAEEERRRAREAEEGRVVGEEAERYRRRCQELEAKGEEQVGCVCVWLGRGVEELQGRMRAIGGCTHARTGPSLCCSTVLCLT